MRKFSLRVRILVCVLGLVLVPMLIMALVLPTRVTRETLALMEENLSSKAKGLGELVSVSLQQQMDMGRGLAALDSFKSTVLKRNQGVLKPEELEEVNLQISNIIKGLGGRYQGVFLCNAEGMIFAGTLKDGSTEAYKALNIVDRAYFVQARESGKPVLSDAVRSKIGNVPIMVIATPIFDAKGGFAGLLGMSLEINYIIDIIAREKIGKSGYPFAVDRKGMIVAHPDAARVLSLDFTKVQGAEKVSALMLKGETGIVQYVSSTGVPKIAAYIPVPLCGWSMAASIDYEEVLTEVGQLRRLIWGLIAVCALVAAGVATWMALSISAPVTTSTGVLTEVSEQMDASAREIASGAQSLASSTSAQAASIEECSASLTELAAATKGNADSATEAARLTAGTVERIKISDTRVRELEQSVQAVATASEQTQKVIKTIDEIAFQTNILALNAAVEAARAGESGAGFAVVADEVRNLAGRAALAAKESGDTLQGAAALVSRSRELAEATSREVAAARVDAEKVGHLVGDIANSCREQSSALDQIHKAVSALEQGVQEAAATSEEAAGAAAMMLGQAERVHGETDVLKRIVRGS